jgi:hypothetical protein
VRAGPQTLCENDAGAHRDFRACGQPLRHQADPGQPEHMNLEPYEFRSPAELIDDIASRVPLTDGTAYLVLVAQPSTAQHMISIDRLDAPAELDDFEEVRDEMRERIEGWPLPDVWPPTHAAVVVVVRRGLCVMGPNEGMWCKAWRYINHHRALHIGDLILVTEHGWVDFMTHLGEVTPALRPA